MIYPETDNLSQYPRYVLALLAAKRAQQLRNKEMVPLVQTDSDNPLSIALEEIAQGKVRPIILSAADVEVEVVAQEAPAADDVSAQELFESKKEVSQTTLSDWDESSAAKPEQETTAMTLTDLSGSDTQVSDEPEPDTISLSEAFRQDEEATADTPLETETASEAIAAPKDKSGPAKKKDSDIENPSNGEVETSIAAVASAEEKPARGKAKKASKEDFEEETGAQTA